MSNVFNNDLKLTFETEIKGFNEIIIKELHGFQELIRSEFKTIKSTLSNSENTDVNDCSFSKEESQIQTNQFEENVQNLNETIENATATARDNTLGPFEITDDSINVSGYNKYRKLQEPNEKCNRYVIRKEAKETKTKRVFKKNILDCEFKADLGELKNPKKHTKKKIIEDLLREEYLKYNNTCILCFYMVTKIKQNTFAYAYCKFNDCTTFRFELTSEGNVTVFRTNELCHAKGETHVGQMRAIKRDVFKDKLQKKSAYKLRQEQIRIASDEVAETGNFQDIQKLETLRKCKSERNFDLYYDADPWIDVYLMKKGPYKNYIQFHGDYLTICLWQRATFETLSQNIKILRDSNFTLHIDATGESVKKIECAEKRVLIYKLILRIGKLKKVLVLAEAILSRHTLTEIRTFLDKLKDFLKENKLKYQFKWPYCKRVCTDASAALYGAILESFNKQTLLDYLRACDKFLNKFEENNTCTPDFVILQWCKCHYIHNICKHLDLHLGKKHILRSLLKNSLIAAFDFSKIEQCLQ